MTSVVNSLEQQSHGIAAIPKIKSSLKRSNQWHNIPLQHHESGGHRVPGTTAAVLIKHNSSVFRDSPITRVKFPQHLQVSYTGGASCPHSFQMCRPKSQDHRPLHPFTTCPGGCVQFLGVFTFKQYSVLGSYAIAPLPHPFTPSNIIHIAREYSHSKTSCYILSGLSD